MANAKKVEECKENGPKEEHSGKHQAKLLAQRPSSHRRAPHALRAASGKAQEAFTVVFASRHPLSALTALVQRGPAPLAAGPAGSTLTHCAHPGLPPGRGRSVPSRDPPQPRGLLTPREVQGSAPREQAERKRLGRAQTQPN